METTTMNAGSFRGTSDDHGIIQVSKKSSTAQTMFKTVLYGVIALVVLCIAVVIILSVDHSKAPKHSVAPVTKLEATTPSPAVTWFTAPLTKKGCGVRIPIDKKIHLECRDESVGGQWTNFAGKFNGERGTDSIPVVNREPLKKGEKWDWVEWRLLPQCPVESSVVYYYFYD